MKTFIIILSLLIIYLIILFVRIKLESNRRRNEFIEYLENKNDNSNLIKFGFYNTSGFREIRRVPFLDEIILDEYKNNKNEFFLEYSVYINQCSKKLLFLFSLAFILFCVVTMMINFGK